LDPASKRGKAMPWKTFLKAHLGVIAATDFFTVEALTLGGLVRYVVWFVIDLESRRAPRATDFDRTAGPAIRSARLGAAGSMCSALIDIWHQTG
jgi:hypothetical protein